MCYTELTMSKSNTKSNTRKQILTPEELRNQVAASLASLKLNINDVKKMLEEEDNRFKAKIQNFMKYVLLSLLFNKLDHRNYNKDAKADFNGYFDEFKNKYNGSIDLMIEDKTNEFVQWLNEFAHESYNEDIQLNEDDFQELKQNIWSEFINITQFAELGSLHTDSQDDLCTMLFTILGILF